MSRSMLLQSSEAYICMAEFSFSWTTRRVARTCVSRSGREPVSEQGKHHFFLAIHQYPGLNPKGSFCFQAHKLEQIIRYDMEQWSQKAKLGCLLELSGIPTPWQAEQFVYHTEFLTRMVAVIALAYSFLELCGTARLQVRHISRGRRTHAVQPPGLISI